MTVLLYPYRILEVDRSDPGDVWTMNLGRNQYPGGGGNSRSAAVNLWSRMARVKPWCSAIG